MKRVLSFLICIIGGNLSVNLYNPQSSNFDIVLSTVFKNSFKTGKLLVDHMLNKSMTISHKTHNLQLSCK